MIAINKKGASPAVYQTVETLQQPELQLIEEKIPVQTELGENELVVGVGVGVGVALTLLILLGVAVRHSSCGRAARGELSVFLECRAHWSVWSVCSGQSLLQREYRGSSREAGGGTEFCSTSDSECMQTLQRKSILKNKGHCDSSPDLIPHHDHGNFVFFLPHCLLKICIVPIFISEKI